VDNNNEKKYKVLGMPHGTAQNKLRKMVLFHLLKKHNENFCFQCGAEIEAVEELSIEHKKPWVNESADLFWDMENIAFSHLKCNTRGPLDQSTWKHGSESTYQHYKCRCVECTYAHMLSRRVQRAKYLK